MIFFQKISTIGLIFRQVRITTQVSRLKGIEIGNGFFSSGPAFTARPDCQSLLDNHKAYVVQNENLHNVDHTCTFLGDSKMIVTTNCSVEFEELTNQVSPLIYSLEEQMTLLRSLSHPVSQQSFKKVFKISAVNRLQFNSSTDVYFMENPWLHLSRKLQFNSITSQFLELRSNVNTVLSRYLPVISQLKTDRRPLSRSILEEIHGKSFIKIDTFDESTAVLKRNYIWTRTQENFPLQKYCIVSLKHRLMLRQGSITMNSSRTDYLSCIKSLQAKESVDKNCYITADVAGPFDIYDFHLNFHPVSIIRVTRGKIIYVACKSASQSWSNKGIFVFIVSKTCLVKVDSNVIQNKNPSITSDMTFKVLINMKYVIPTGEDYVFNGKNALQGLLAEQKAELKQILVQHNKNKTYREDDHSAEIEFLQIFDIGIAGAFVTTALALIILFCKLLKSRNVQNNNSQPTATEMQSFIN